MTKSIFLFLKRKIDNIYFFSKYKMTCYSAQVVKGFLLPMIH